MSKSTRFSSDIVHGVYKIENILNGNIYVGSSKDIYGRWVQHKRDLRKGTHHSKHLQSAWNKYKEHNFKFDVIEITDSNKKVELFECEKKWYDYYNSCGTILYNMCPIVITPTYFTTIEDLKNGRRKITYEQFIDVCWYLERTNLPITKISKLTKVLDRTIYEIYFRKQYVELTKDICFTPRTVLDSSQKYNSKLTINDVKEILNHFQKGVSIKTLLKQYNVGESTLYDIYYRRTWKNLSDGLTFSPLIKSDGTTGKPVLQYDLQMNLVAEYRSAREAESATGIGYKMISRVCNGHRPYTHGFIFKFK